MTGGSSCTDEGGGGENLNFHGYRRSGCKTAISYLLCFVTLGLLRLFFYWFPTWHLYATHSKCSLRLAEKVLVIECYQSLYKAYFVETVRQVSLTDRSNRQLLVHLEDGTVQKDTQMRMVWCKKLCYVWSESSSKFLKLSGLDRSMRCVDYHDFQGYSDEERGFRSITYGRNIIDVPLNTILSLFFLEVLTPFYFFQVFSLIVWFLDEYYYYTSAIIIMSVFGVSTSILQTRKNQKSLRKSVDSSATVTVCKGEGVFEEVPSTDLVPGDLIELPKNGCVMQCDAVLISGNCIVNESMLTGESIPITKTPIPKTDRPYDIQEGSFHTLFCGTTVIQTRSRSDHKVLAVVIRTGFLTSKGELVRSILYPTPTDFKFDQDSFKVIGILSVVALLGSVYTIVSKSTRSIEVGYIFLKALDLITIVIPPALPATITIGKLYALNRLKKKQIFCINSKVINVSGTVNCMCFDKTGTLTEDGLDMWGVVPCQAKRLEEPLKNVAELPCHSRFLNGMATCHSLTLLEDHLIGDPLDVKMFESTAWSLCENNVTHTTTVKTEGAEMEILHKFPFYSNLQRMSVIATDGRSDVLRVFCKGSPEMIASLSLPPSVPEDLQERLKAFTRHGYRVIAMGSKELQDVKDADVSGIDRKSVECDLTFEGLIILENRVKPVTARVIKTLRDADVKTVMITGDNMETALSVAKECGIVGEEESVVVVDVDQGDGHPTLLYSTHESSILESTMVRDAIVPIAIPDVRYALDGKTWRTVRQHFSHLLDEFVQRGVVFARMSGLQKQELIQELKKQGYYTGMCGDGANDCGALKTSHVGISLSEDESSIASPFTSKQNDISCVEEVIREGQAALATSMGIFKYMICYSTTQFSSVLILYGIDDNLTSLQFLFVDIVIILNLISTFGRTKPFKGTLSKNRPLDSLLSSTSVSSILLQLLFVITFLVSSYNLIQIYDWFVPFQFDPENVLALKGYENYAVYVMSLFQYIIMIVAFSKGKPFRRPIYTNKVFFIDAILTTLLCIYILFYPAEWIIKILDLEVPPDYQFNVIVLIFAIAHFACALICEDVIVEYFLSRKLYPKLYDWFKRTKQKSKGNKENGHILDQKNGYVNKAYSGVSEFEIKT